jgi:hypothetical protein
MTQSKLNRRKFVAAASTAFSFTYIPRRVWGANDRFYVAGIGVGGKGAGEVKDITEAGGTFVARHFLVLTMQVHSQRPWSLERSPFDLAKRSNGIQRNSK